MLQDKTSGAAGVAVRADRTQGASSQGIRVPLMDLKAQYQAVRAEVIEGLHQVLDSSAYVLGPKVVEFEREFAAYVGAKHCVAVNSGTSAVHMGMIAAGVGRDDEVVTVPMTFIATAWGVSYQGARPVFVDVDRETYTMDVRQVEKKLTKRTKALLPVHLYGLAADMEPLVELSKKHGIPLVEDCAQAHGAKYRGRPVGTFGVCGCYSFYPGKNLGAYGEGGAVVTNDDELAGRLRRLRDHGQGQRYYHDEIGFNYRMDGVQGAVLGVKLKRLSGWTESRRTLAQRYQAKLAGMPLRLPVEPSERTHVWHLFVVLHEKRDRIRQGLEERGIQTGLHYPVPVHMQKAYAHLGHKEGEFPVAERVARECLTLPLFAEMTEQQQDEVVDALEEVLTEVGQ